MTPPTRSEVQYGCNKITEDGPQAQITHELSMLAAFDPQLSDTLRRMRMAAETLNLFRPADMEGLLAGALVYGLHLGLHIGEARCERQNRADHGIVG